MAITFPRKTVEFLHSCKFVAINQECVQSVLTFFVPPLGQKTVEIGKANNDDSAVRSVNRW